MSHQTYFTARTARGPIDVAYWRTFELFGIPGFTGHRQVTRDGLVPNYYTISHLETGLRMPGSPARTVGQALKNCYQAMAQKGITRADLERKLAEFGK